jgi:hypothetical protein
MPSALVFQTLARQIKIGGLPSRAGLNELHRQGFRHLINVSGAAAASLYADTVLAHFTLYEPTPFRDIFSSYQDTDADVETYVKLSESNERSAFLGAVRYLNQQLYHAHPCYVFCRCGEGRSPAVSMTALHLRWRIPLQTAAQLIQQIRPQAKITPLSYAAARWTALRPMPSHFYRTTVSHAIIRGFSERLDRATASA